MEDLVTPARLKSYAGRRVLVTGDTGFIGSWLTLWLAELGANVHGLALPPLKENVLFPTLVAAGLVRHTDCDVRDAEAVHKAFAEAQPEIVFHLAAQSLVRRSYDEPQLTFATNLLGSVNILEAVRKCESVRSLVYITSDKCYLNKEWPWGYRENDELGGRDPYSASKACAELAIRAYDDSFFTRRAQLGAASTRAGNVIGGGDRNKDRIMVDTITALESGQPIVLRNPQATRPWQHVLDPVHGYLKLGLALLAEPRRFAGAWNFGPDERAIRTVDDLAHRAAEFWGGGEIIHMAAADAPHESTLLHLSSAKANRLLRWQAQWDFDRAVAETVAWYRAVHDGVAPLAISRRQISNYISEIAAA